MASIWLDLRLSAAYTRGRTGKGLDLAAHIDALWLPATPQEKEEVQQQLQRLLASPVFRNSQRYPALLRYVVEQTLAGEADLLKERTLGIAVFHRTPDYDTNGDPVVRVSAGEVRKRLAQYYQEHPGELRIDLPAGSYVPQFRPVPQVSPNPPQTAQPSHPPEASPPGPLPQTVPTAGSETSAERPRRGPWLLLGAVLLLLAAAAGVLLVQRVSARSLTRQFWSPLTQAGGVPLFVLGDHLVPLSDLGRVAQAFAAPMAEQAENPRQPMPPLAMLPVGDALAFARVTAMLGVPFNAESETRTSLDNLRARPAVLFGAFNNQWSLHATRGLRFRFDREFRPDGSQVVSIVDSASPTGRRWAIVWSQPLESKMHDYALVARFFDPENEKEVVVIAGLGENGTVAASEFVTNSRYLKQLDSYAPRGGWAHRNLEAVIETPVVNGLSGPPHLEAACFW